MGCRAKSRAPGSSSSLGITAFLPKPFMSWSSEVATVARIETTIYSTPPSHRPNPIRCCWRRKYRRADSGCIYCTTKATWNWIASQEGRRQGRVRWLTLALKHGAALFCCVSRRHIFFIFRSMTGRRKRKKSFRRGQSNERFSSCAPTDSAGASKLS